MPANNLELGITLTAEGDGLSGEIRIAEEDLERLRRTTEDTGRAADRAGREMDDLGDSTQNAGKKSDGMATAMRSLRNLFVTIGVAALAREFIQLGDEYTQIQNKLRLVTDGTQELVDVQGKLLDVANASYQGYSSTVDLYSKLARGTEELGYSQAELLTVTETVTKSIALSGASAQAADAALVQLSQGLASGTLRGDELNSVMEQTPGLARAIAEGMGIATGELREMGAAGEITAQAVMDALLNMSDSVEAEFAGMTPTVSQAWTQLKNNTLEAVGAIDEATGGTEALSGAMVSLAGMIGKASEAIKEFRALDILDAISGINSDISRISTPLETLMELGASGGLEGQAGQLALVTREIQELEASLGSMRENYEATTQLLASGTPVHEEVRRAYGRLWEAINQGETDLAKLQTRQAAYKTILGEMPAILEENARGTDDAAGSVKTLTTEQIAHIEAMRELSDEMERYQDLLMGLTEEDLAHEAAINRVNDAVGALIITQAEAAEIIAMLDSEFLEVTKTTEKATIATQANAAEAEPFASAWENAIKRVDDAFAGIWKGIWDGFEGLTDNLLDALKTTISEMAHTALTKPIVLSITAGFSGTASAGGPGGFGGLSSLLGGNGIGEMFQGAGDWLFSNTSLPVGNLMEAGQLSNASFGLAGLLGGIGGNALFGGYGGVGGSLGATVGMAFGGPIGAILGGLGGGFLGGLFGGGGGDKTPDLQASAAGFGEDEIRTTKSGGVNIQSLNIESEFGAYGIKTKHDAFPSQAAAQAFAEALLLTGDLENAIAEHVGPEMTETIAQAVSDVMGDGLIKLAEEGGEFAEGLEGLLSDRFGAIFETIGDGTGELFQSILVDAPGAAEAAAVVLSLMQSIENLGEVGQTAAEAIKDLRQTEWDRLVSMQEGILELAEEFDGTYDSALELADQIAQFEGAAVLAIIAIENLKEQISGMFDGLRSSIEDFGKSEEELIADRLSEVDRLYEELQGETSASRIAEISNDIRDLVSQAWSAMGEETRELNQEALLALLDSVTETALAQAQAAQDAVETMAADAASATADVFGANSAFSEGAENISSAGRDMVVGSEAIRAGGASIEQSATTIAAAAAQILAAASTPLRIELSQTTSEVG